MLKHTPGPWFIVDTTHQMNFSDTTVCQLKYVGQEKEMFIGSAATNHGDVEATAKLIAAAPQLLEALIKMYLAEYSPQDEPLEKVMLVGEVFGDEFERSIIEVIRKAI